MHLEKHPDTQNYITSPSAVFYPFQTHTVNMLHNREWDLIPGWWAGPSAVAEAGWVEPPEAVAGVVGGCGSPAAALRTQWLGRGSGLEWGEEWGVWTGVTGSGRQQGLMSGESGVFEGFEWQVAGWCHSVKSLLRSSGPQTSLGSPPPGCWQTAASLRRNRRNRVDINSGFNWAITIIY